MLVPIDLRWQPLGMRGCSDHEEETVGLDRFLYSMGLITKHQALDPPVAPTVDDLGHETNLQIWRRLHLPDEVVRHAFVE